VTYRLLPILATGLWLVLWAPPVWSVADDGCDAWRTRWINAFQRLRDGMDSAHQLKEGSLASRIQQEMGDRENAVSVARSVQAALKERSDALNRGRDQCRNLAMEEHQAFERWRACAVGGNMRRGAAQASGLDAAAIERKKLLASLQDLLLDEAYVQYKNYQPPTPPAYSEYDQQPWGMGRNAGYNPQPGYGGYR
jgi:hypothetical protein